MYWYIEDIAFLFSPWSFFPHWNDIPGQLKYYNDTIQKMPPDSYQRSKNMLHSDSPPGAWIKSQLSHRFQKTSTEIRKGLNQVDLHNSKQDFHGNQNSNPLKEDKRGRCGIPGMSWFRFSFQYFFNFWFWFQEKFSDSTPILIPCSQNCSIPIPIPIFQGE